MIKRKLILHIGTEKTGTTSIQESLFHNKELLMECEKVYFMQSIGDKNNRLLPAAFMSIDKKDDFFIKSEIDDTFSRTKFKENVINSFKKEYENIPDDVNAVIISSEHFQSRLDTISEIKELSDFLSEYFYEVKIVCYIRDMYSYFLSSYSTEIKAGRIMSIEEYLLQCNSGNLFFNHYLMLEMWSEVFGVSNIVVRDFSKYKLKNKDVVDDFYNVISMSDSFLKNEHRLNLRFNESLNNSGIYWALVINSLLTFQEFKIKNRWRSKIRSIIINRILIKLFSGKITGYSYMKEAIDKDFQSCKKNLNEKYIGKYNL